MAEFLNQATEPPMSPFDAMGKPLGAAAREAGYSACKAMGLEKARAVECASATAEQLERDQPYQALKAAMRFLDLTGAYRLMATLLSNAGVTTLEADTDVATNRLDVAVAGWSDAG